MKKLIKMILITFVIIVFLFLVGILLVFFVPASVEYVGIDIKIINPNEFLIVHSGILGDGGGSFNRDVLKDNFIVKSDKWTSDKIDIFVNDTVETLTMNVLARSHCNPTFACRSPSNVKLSLHKNDILLKTVKKELEEIEFVVEKDKDVQKYSVELYWWFQKREEKNVYVHWLSDDEFEELKN